MPPRRAAARTRRVPLLLATADVIGVAGGLALAAVLIGDSSLATVVGTLALLLARASAGLWRHRLRLAWIRDLPREALCVLVVLGATTLAGGPQPEPMVMVVVATLAAMARAGAMALMRGLRRRPGGDRPVLVVGPDAISEVLVAELTADPAFGLRPVARLVRQRVPDAAASPRSSVPVLTGDLLTAARRVGAAAVLFADAPPDQVAAARDAGLEVVVLPGPHEFAPEGPSVHRLGRYPLWQVPPATATRPAYRVALLTDRVLAAVALIALVPVLAACAVAVLVELGRPVLFQQVRVGCGGRPFTMVKFRSLPPDPAADLTWSVDGDPRMGPVGRLLRHTSLDELPQLWNVVRGQMRLIGPRPERPAFVDEFRRRHGDYLARHRLPGGITGLAQVHGLRGDSSIGERLRHDIHYIEQWSPRLDLWIGVRTLRELVRHIQQLRRR